MTDRSFFLQSTFGEPLMDSNVEEEEDVLFCDYSLNGYNNEEEETHNVIPISALSDLSEIEDSENVVLNLDDNISSSRIEMSNEEVGLLSIQNQLSESIEFRRGIVELFSKFIQDSFDRVPSDLMKALVNSGSHDANMNESLDKIAKGLDKLKNNQINNKEKPTYQSIYNEYIMEKINHIISETNQRHSQIMEKLSPK